MQLVFLSVESANCVLRSVGTAAAYGKSMYVLNRVTMTKQSGRLSVEHEWALVICINRPSMLKRTMSRPTNNSRRGASKIFIQL